MLTRSLLMICGLTYATQHLSGSDALIERFAVFGPAITNGEWWRVVTGAFLHANLPHLVMNLVSLAALGKLIEADLRVGGAWRYPTVCAASLLGAAAGVLLLSFQSLTVGISGLVFGLLGASIAIPRRAGLSWNAYGALPWLGINVVVTFAVPGISVGGHLGGLAGGFLAAWVLFPAGLQPLAAEWREPHQ